MFIDLVKVYVKAGKGGDGAISFRREKYVPAGGPDGGDGGRGGNVVVIGDEGVRTLLDFRYQRRYLAENGENGRGRKQFGKDGADVVLKVPVGTLVKDAETGGVILDVREANKEYLLCRGGRGGYGNTRYKNAVRQAPRFAQPGRPGEEREVTLELKLIADVGLVGLPNVGKSTLLSIMSSATPKIANYHFTTLSPNLGVVYVDEEASFVVADIPGLIEGASEGVGLGHDFLRHVERTALICHVVDASGSEGRNPVEDYASIKEELRLYHPDLLEKQRVLVANKTDLGGEEYVEELRRLAEHEGLDFYVVSGATQKGVKELIYGLWRALGDMPRNIETYDEAYIAPKLEEEPYTIRVEDGVFIVEGPFAEDLLYRTDMNDYESLIYFQELLYKKGIIDELEELGMEDGSTVLFAGYEMEWQN